MPLTGIGIAASGWHQVNAATTFALQSELPQMKDVEAMFRIAFVFPAALAGMGCDVDEQDTGPKFEELRADCGYLMPGESLRKNQSVSSCDGRTKFLVSPAGVLVGKRDEVIFFSPVAGVEEIAMQRDGNLVAYDYKGEAIWQSGTLRAGSRLAIQDDGNLVVYSFLGQAQWASGTVLPPRPPPGYPTPLGNRAVYDQGQGGFVPITPVTENEMVDYSTIKPGHYYGTGLNNPSDVPGNQGGYENSNSVWGNSFRQYACNGCEHPYGQLTWGFHYFSKTPIVECHVEAISPELVNWWIMPSSQRNCGGNSACTTWGRDKLPIRYDYALHGDYAIDGVCSMIDGTVSRKRLSTSTR